MQTLAFKALFQKKGTASAIIAFALLIALLTSVNCLVNNINEQTAALTQLASIGQTYIITSQNSNSLSNSQVPSDVAAQLNDNPKLNYATAQQITQATLTVNNQTYAITVNAVDNVQTYVDSIHANVSGSIAQTPREADVGVILANIASVQKNEQATLTIGTQSTQVKIVGITQAKQQSDTQLIVPLATYQSLTNQNSYVSYIEFQIKDPAQSAQVIKNITQTLPSNVKITSTQQVAPFAVDLNNQTVNFINVWSIAIYAVVLAASYVTASRLVNESEYELYVLRAVGTKKKSTLGIVITCALTIAFFGAVLGVSVGIVGTQLAATGVRWLWGNTQLAPLIDVNQTAQILVLSLATSLAGALYPAFKGTRTILKEAPQ